MTSTKGHDVAVRELDRVTITGPTTGTMAQPLTLTAAVEGVDPGASAAYQWELLSGVANLGPTNQATLSITAADADVSIGSNANGDFR